MFIDTHCHLNIMVDKKIDQPLTQEHLEKIDLIVQDSKAGGISKFINIGTNLLDSCDSIILAKRYSQVYASVGIHPCDCTSEVWNDLKKIRNLLENGTDNKIVAIGETGLDYFHTPFDKDLQASAFRAHIELAIEFNMPLVIHIRNAYDDALAILSEYSGKISGVNHCFSSNYEYAKKVLDLGLFLGIDAPITYPKNKDLREVVSSVSLDHIVLETDAPFLPPQEFRGKQNHPKYIPIFAQTIADLKGISLFDVAAITTTNAEKLFRLF